MAEWLHDDFLCIANLVNDHAELTGVSRENHEVQRFVLAAFSCHSKHVSQIDYRKQFAAQSEHARRTDSFELIAIRTVDSNQLNEVHLADGIGGAIEPDYERRDDRKCQWDLDDQGRALPDNGLDVEGSTDLFDVGAHDIHTDAAP